MKLIISLGVETGDALTGADLSQLISHVLAVRDLAHGGRVQPQPEAPRPESPAPARREPDRGDAWEPPFDEFQELPRGYPGSTPSPRTSAEPEEEDPEESPPTDGRQLLARVGGEAIHRATISRRHDGAVAGAAATDERAHGRAG